jgi:hypothetical protein
MPVEIDCGAARLVRFEPLRRDKRSGRLDLPFTFRGASSTLTGLVHLKSSSTPLAIRELARDGEPDLPEVWALVLEVAAARYCASLEEERPENYPFDFVPDASTRAFDRTPVVGPPRVRVGGCCSYEDMGVGMAGTALRSRQALANTVGARLPRAE